MPPSAAALRHAAAQKEAAAKKQTVKVQDVGVRQRGLKYLEGKYESKMHPGSALKDRTTEYPTFDLSQLTQGKVLGTGGFGTVKEVTGIQVGGGGGGGVKPFVNTPTKPALVDVTDGSSNSDNVPHGTGEEDDVVQNGMLESQNFIAQHCIRKGGDARYAIKHLKPDVMNDTGLFLQGVIDLAVEARFLSDIEHPNIIKLRGLSNQSPFDCEANGKYSYFLLMDRLYDTLERRLGRWAKVANKGKKGLFARKAKASEVEELFKERIIVAFDLSAALDYLHGSCNMCYRDIKPENIGFDIRDDVKLFDFGLSKELNRKDLLNDGTYKMTEMTGSPRYMAPEVAQGLPYNQTCDSYSFAILLWQILACQVPYEHYNMTTLKTKVWAGPCKRPPLPKEPTENFPASIQNLLERAWAPSLHERKGLSYIKTALRKECMRVQGGDDSNLSHDMRRSTFVFRGDGSGSGNNSSVLSAKHMAELQQLAEVSEGDEEE
mmetsp:Transcript_29977/g.69905  ORF Transcript_29977/g.69905 Transcript_29977/m.69905 type:complete len:490 (-) Transcript_29977:131-1600(-)